MRLTSSVFNAGRSVKVLMERHEKNQVAERAACFCRNEMP